MNNKGNKRDIILREHKFDGIQEYDQKLPNWWLTILYVTIIFCTIFWMYHFQFGGDRSDGTKVTRELSAIEAAALNNQSEALTDDALWAMSQNDAFVNSGEKIYKNNCAACHGSKLEGAIGVPLNDAIWVHGGEPLKISETISAGVLAKGMPAWGSVLGKKRINDVVAYILSHHQKPE